MKNKLSHLELKKFLDEHYLAFNQPSFIAEDPISIPHRFKTKQDREISGFLTSLISWGSRKSILKSADRLLSMMNHSPYDFILHAKKSDWIPIQNFVHRTFNGDDAIGILQALQQIYINEGGLEPLFNQGYKKTNNLLDTISFVREKILRHSHLARTEKHLANPSKNSAAKRINMFLRWMVRKDVSGVDFGLWEFIPSSALYIPLDIHTGNTARQLGLLKRKQNDRKAVEELTQNLRLFDPDDPVKYDFALFGLGLLRKENRLP